MYNKKYKGIITMKDGTKSITFFQQTEEDVLRVVREQMRLTNRYYRKDGVDYGKSGKLFTFEEEHGGLKELTIIEFSETNRKIITEI